ncbi:hypothetical protein B0H14DRAFT_2696998 [Mycena olivaceomarginata]|nr:hypothetical protein B0H14DRAFT_2696998 [Mycena olivaceomarginata]
MAQQGNNGWSDDGEPINIPDDLDGKRMDEGVAPLTTPDPSPLAPGTVSYSMSFTCSTTPTSRVPLLRYSIASTTLPPHPQEVRRRAHTREDPYIRLQLRHVLHNSQMHNTHAHPMRKWKRTSVHATTRDYTVSILAPTRNGNRASLNAIAERQGHADRGVGGTTTRSRCSCRMDMKRNGCASEQHRREHGREQCGSAQTHCGLRTWCGHRVASRKGCSSDASMRVQDGMGAAAQTGAAWLRGGSGRRTGRVWAWTCRRRRGIHGGDRHRMERTCRHADE